MTLPARQGLYDPANEHDACGVGFVADIKGRKSHQIVRDGLQILVNLDHRGAVGADPLMGDGAGCMIQMPDRLLRDWSRKNAVELPPPGTASVREAPPPMVSEQDRLSSLIAGGSLLVVMASFFGFGLLLAFTPCVLPMIPILSGIIAGQGAAATPRRSFLLSLTYVLGMALTYTAAGAAFAAAGQQAQAFFQQPWIIITFAALFVVLALAMFGLFDLKIPAPLETRLAAVSGRQKSGTFVGTAIMGALSALVVTACVAPPMVAALAVIGQTGDPVRGGLALFALSMGMGVPLLLIGTSLGKLLPRAGGWMETVKQVFGVLLLGVALWFARTLLPESVVMLLWGLLAIGLALLLGALAVGGAMWLALPLIF